MREAPFAIEPCRIVVRHWIWISLLAFLGIVAGAALLANPWAERIALNKARARGLEISVKNFSLGFMSADLIGVDLKLAGVEGVSAHIRKLHVSLNGGSPRIRRIVVDGATIKIDGNISSIKNQLQAWRTRRGLTPQTTNTGKNPRHDIARNLHLEWKNAFVEGDTQIIEGLNFDRNAKTQRIGADLVSLSWKNIEAKIAGSELELARGGFDLSTASKVRASEVRFVYKSTENSDSESRETQQASLKKTHKIPAAKVPAAEKTAGLEKRLIQNDERVAKLVGLLHILHEEMLGRLPAHAQVDKLWLTYLNKKEKLHVGPSLLTAKKKGASYQIAVTPRGEVKGTPLSFSLTMSPPKSPSAALFEVQGGPISLSTLGIDEGAFGLKSVSHSYISGKLKAELSGNAQTVSWGGETTIEGLALQNSRLSDELVSFPRLHLDTQGELSVNGTHIHLEKSDITLGETRFEGEFELKRKGESVLLKATAKAPLVSCQALLDSTPRGLLGAVERIRFNGTFSLDAGVQVDSRNLSGMKVRWNFKNGCRAVAVPPELAPSRFKGTFRREVAGAGNYPMDVEFGPHSANWAPWVEVSPHLENALLVSEDGRFFRHNGFDNRAIENAIRTNAKAGRFVLGASTITMQLAKNLYLSREKTLARKLREAALTSLLEQSFEKKELLELYVNVVEFGPGIYGIRQAAEYYFNTTPEALTAAQAFFIGSILPQPTRNYFEEDGTMTSSRRAYVNELLSISSKRGRINEAELDAAQDEILIFGQAETRPPEELDPESSLSALPDDTNPSALHNTPPAFTPPNSSP